MIHLCVLLFGFAGCAAICVSMSKHQSETLGRKLAAGAQLGLRAAGWAALACAYGSAVVASGWKFGAVEWVGALGISALVLVAGLLPYHARLTPRAGVGAAVAGIVLAGLAAVLALP